jgi:PilZ domain
MDLGRFSGMGVSRRKSPRERKDDMIRLELDDGSPSVCGTLCDLSATGAQMSLPSLYNMPARFALILPPNTRRSCRLVWQSGQRIGVEFMSV